MILSFGYLVLRQILQLIVLGMRGELGLNPWSQRPARSRFRRFGVVRLGVDGAGGQPGQAVAWPWFACP